MGEKSEETITHFSCEECFKWFSVSDAPDRNKWYCPHCGKNQEFSPK